MADERDITELERAASPLSTTSPYSAISPYSAAGPSDPSSATSPLSATSPSNGRLSQVYDNTHDTISSWEAGVPRGHPPLISPTPVSVPPLPTPMMVFEQTRPPTATTFPMVRGQNLDRLTRAYYRVYSRYGPLVSNFCLHADDPSISQFYIEHVPPPRLASNFISFICARERIHTSRVKLYRENGQEGSLEPVPEDARLTGAMPEDNPLMIFVIMLPTDTRKDAAEPAPLLDMSRRKCGSCLSFTLFGLCTCLVFSGACLKACPRNSRACWVETWTCGDPSLYQPAQGDVLLCCCYWSCTPRVEQPPP